MPDEQRDARADVPPWPRAYLRGMRAALPGDADADPGIRTVSVAFTGNLAVAVAKWAGTLISGSPALLAESLHSTAVTVNQALLLQGQLTSMRPATREHPFGYGQARYFWAFIVSIAIFGLGAVLSVGRGLLALTDGHNEPVHLLVPYVTLGVGLIMDGWSFVVGTRQAHAEKGELSYWQYIRRSKNPEVPVVVLEDTAALIGLFLAYLGIGLSVLTGREVFDDVASILIGLLLATIAFILAREMKSLLIGESAGPDEEDRIRAALSEHEQVCEIVYFRSLYVGPEDLLVEAKVAFRRDATFPDVVQAIDAMEDEVRERVPTVRVVSIEPGLDLAEDRYDLPSYQQDERRG